MADHEGGDMAAPNEKLNFENLAQAKPEENENLGWPDLPIVIPKAEPFYPPVKS